MNKQECRYLVLSLRTGSSFLGKERVGEVLLEPEVASTEMEWVRSN